MSLPAIAAELDACGIAARTDKTWNPMQVLDAPRGVEYTPKRSGASILLAPLRLLFGPNCRRCRCRCRCLAPGSGLAWGRDLGPDSGSDSG